MAGALVISIQTIRRHRLHFVTYVIVEALPIIAIEDFQVANELKNYIYRFLCWLTVGIL